METNALPSNTSGAQNSVVTDQASYTLPCVDPAQPSAEVSLGGCWYRPAPMPPRVGPQTVEDRILELLCSIMQKMDARIEQHAKEIQALQEGSGGAGAGSGTSVDIETMKLKHEIDQRTAMFDMLRSIMDKYEQTTTEVVRSMGR